MPALRVADRSPVAGIEVRCRIVRREQDQRVQELELARGAAGAADRRATELLKTIGQPSAPRPRFLALLMASRAALAVGDAVRAADHARAALRIVEPIARSLDTSADVGDALLLLGRALLVQQQKEAARITIARAERCLNNGYGAEHPRSREARDLRASLPPTRQRYSRS